MQERGLILDRRRSLIVNGAAIDRGGRRVFAGVTFRLDPGEALELTGPNGAGKSTLLRGLAGLLPLAAGTVALRSDAGAPDELPLSEGVHLLGHADGLKTALTPRENLAFAAALAGDTPGAPLLPPAGEGGRRPDEVTLVPPDPRLADLLPDGEKGLVRQEPEEALAHLGLAAIADLPVAYLSAGQRRRVALARLLVAWRPLWLLDEPVNALDAAAQQVLRGLIARHRAAGGLVVAATHASLGMAGTRHLRLEA